ncbi:MAG: hypothetical protein KC877_02175 [Candidatus Kaiserbacteria bacterium]|nr:hypothetical protein [Candidatus Kaiserbacteria bacterium]MCB9816172.1 hypothetical protein [Candidatus Nomurabacteria bacterium]
MIRKHVWWLLLCSLVLSGVSTAAPSQAKREFCLGKDDMWSATEHKQRMTEVGITCATLYYKLMSDENRANPYEWVRREYLDHGYEVVLTVIVDDGVTSTVGSSEATSLGNEVAGIHWQVLTGVYDEALYELSAKIKKDGRQLAALRVMHELNGNWYPWGMYATGNTPELAVAAESHIVSIFEREKVNVRYYEVNYNRTDAGGEGVLKDGDRYVAQINRFMPATAISTYNRCGTAPKYRYERSFQYEFRPIYNELIRRGVAGPINIAEVSTSGQCTGGKKVAWFRKMLESIHTDFPRVEMITFYFGQVPVGKASNTVVIDWGLSDDAERRAFRDLLSEYRQKWAGTIDVPEQERSVRKDFRAPFNFYVKMTLPFDEADNPAINPASGQPFGKAGPLIRGHVRQRALWGIAEDVEAGPGLKFGFVEAPDNNEQWWNNQTYAEASLGTYGKLPHDSLVWGNWSLELVGRQTWFTTGATPDRYSDRQDNYVGLQFTVSGEVDLAR